MNGGPWCNLPLGSATTGYRNVSMIPKMTLPLSIFTILSSPKLTLSSTMLISSMVSNIHHCVQNESNCPSCFFFNRSESFCVVLFFFFFYGGTEEGGGDHSKELVSMGALKWRKGRALTEVPRYIEKAPKIVNVKVSPRTIQQPR